MCAVTPLASIISADSRPLTSYRQEALKRPASAVQSRPWPPFSASTKFHAPIFRAALAPLREAQQFRPRPSERPASAVQSRPWPPFSASTKFHAPIFRAALAPLREAQQFRPRPSERQASAVQSRPWPPLFAIPPIPCRARAFARSAVVSPAALRKADCAAEQPDLPRPWPLLSNAPGGHSNHSSFPPALQ